MNYIWLLLIFTLIMTTSFNICTAEESPYEEKDKSCEPNECALTNTTVKWVNDEKQINTYITCTGNETHYCTILIKNCTILRNNKYMCTERLYIAVANSSNIVYTACKETGKREQQEKWLTDRYGPILGEELIKHVLCIDVDKKN